jgi:hypothetical protein
MPGNGQRGPYRVCETAGWAASAGACRKGFSPFGGPAPKRPLNCNWGARKAAYCGWANDGLALAARPPPTAAGGGGGRAQRDWPLTSVQRPALCGRAPCGLHPQPKIGPFALRRRAPLGPFLRPQEPLGQGARFLQARPRPHRVGLTTRAGLKRWALALAT